MMLADIYDPRPVYIIVIFLAVVVSVMIGTNPLIGVIRRREQRHERILHSALLLNISPRSVTVGTAGLMLLFGAIAMVLLDGSLIAGIIAGAAGMLIPGMVIRVLIKRRLQRLEEQLVSAVQTLASGVRAGLNLVQAMQMVARDAPVPICQEFAHLVQEYEYGVPLDEAMNNAASRIGSSDFRLLFTALHTHRERGGNLGETLDRIAKSIREIQRLENKVRTETARGRATARWLGALPGIVLGILYLISSDSVLLMFTDQIGKIMLGIVILFNLIGYLWIRKIMAIDI